MRGVFTAGVLDAFLDKRIRNFDGYYGVSAGALNLSSFIAGQRGRNLELYTNLCLSPKFISMSRHLKGGNLFDLDWFFNKINLQHSLDRRRFNEHLTQRTFTVVTTNGITGEPDYQNIRPDSLPEDITNLLKATSALPMIYRTPILIGDQPMMDGSLSDPIPVNRAIIDGFDKIILVRTRPRDERKKASTSSRMYAWQQRRQPAIAKLIRQQYTVYNDSIDNFTHLENRSIELIQVAPDKPLDCTRSTRNRSRLVADYHLGYKQGYMLAEKLKT